MQRTANYLNGMGTSYVIRLMSNAGLETALRPSGLDQSHINYWDALRMRLVRLHGFSAEISGQRQSDATRHFSGSWAGGKLFCSRGGSQSSDAKTRRENDFHCRHCEERSDEAIQNLAEDWIASLRSQ